MVAMNLGVPGIERLEVLAFLLGYFSHFRHMFACEQQLFRIEISSLGESLRFLRTAARVRGVHKTTLVLHERVQIATRTCDVLPEIVAANIEQLRSNAVAHAEEGCRVTS